MPRVATGQRIHLAVSRRRGAVWMLLGALVLVGAAGCSDGLRPEDGVNLEQARTELEAGRAVLIDIREPAEHATGVARGARLIPMKQLASRLGEIAVQADQPVYLICQTQSRSRATLAALRERGYAQVRYVRGGMAEWAHRGWPLVAPPR